MTRTDTAGPGGEPGQAPEPPRQALRGWGTVAEWVGLFGVAILVAFVVQTFLFGVFYIPSTSMTPTLKVGDRVVVNKLSYQFHDIRRGDLVVFKAPESARESDITDYVKRVIALPGETIEWRDEDGVSEVYVDGQRLDEPYLPDHAVGRTRVDGVPPGCAATTTDPYMSCTVPAGSIFVMGDNRTSSKDSRSFGPIPEDSVVGRVFIRIWPPTTTWLYLAIVVGGLFALYWGLHAFFRSRRNAEGPEPPPQSPGAGPGSSSATTSTIDWTRSE